MNKEEPDEQSGITIERGLVDRGQIKGHALITVSRHNDDTDEDEIVSQTEVDNLVTQVGDQYYAERAAAGIAGSPLSAGPSQVSGMRLGTGTTAASKTGAGAAIVTYITGSQHALSSGYPISSLSGSSRRIQWQAVWAAGESTNSAITEAVLTNEATLTNVAGTAANTIGRIVFTAQNKGALDTLTVLWSHDFLGA